jgi:hypothetical protein
LAELASASQDCKFLHFEAAVPPSRSFRLSVAGAESEKGGGLRFVSQSTFVID